MLYRAHHDNVEVVMTKCSRQAAAQHLPNLLGLNLDPPRALLTILDIHQVGLFLHCHHHPRHHHHHYPSHHHPAQHDPSPPQGCHQLEAQAQATDQVPPQPPQCGRWAKDLHHNFDCNKPKQYNIKQEFYKRIIFFFKIAVAEQQRQLRAGRSPSDNRTWGEEHFHLHNLLGVLQWIY